VIEYFSDLFYLVTATFHNTGQLNQYNSHYWSVENQHWYREVNH